MSDVQERYEDDVSLDSVSQSLSNLVQDFKAGPYARASRFFITINEKALGNWEKIRDYVKKFKNFRYGCAIKEHNSKNKEHIHLYLEYESDIRLLYKRMLGANVQKAFGKQKDIFIYFQKEADEYFWEEGVPLKFNSGKPKKDEMETFLEYTIGQVKDMTEEQRLKLPTSCFNVVKHFNLEERNVFKLGEWHKDKFKAVYIYGPSGVGKSKLAEMMIEKEGYDRFCVFQKIDSFYHGFTPLVKAAIYDDFRPGDMKAVEFINLIDYNRHYLNVKNLSYVNNLELIIFTSIISPHDLYEHLRQELPESAVQWLRRLECINMEELEKYDLGINMKDKRKKKAVKLSENAGLYLKELKAIALDNYHAFDFDFEKKKDYIPKNKDDIIEID